MATKPVRSAKAPKEVRITLKPATAKNLLQLDAALEQAMGVVNAIQNRLADQLRPIYTENGIEEGRVLELSKTAPHELVIVVLKRAKEG